MGAHSNYLTLEGDEAMAIVLMIFFAIIGIAMLIMTVINKHNNAIQQRNDKQKKQRKANAIRKEIAYQKTLNNFYRNRVEEDMFEVTSQPFKLDNMSQNLVDAYRS